VYKQQLGILIHLKLFEVYSFRFKSSIYNFKMYTVHGVNGTMLTEKSKKQNKKNNKKKTRAKREFQKQH